MTGIKQKFGTGVKKRRMELKITQEELAERAVLHRTYVAEIERGKRNLSLENIVKIIQALDLSISDFFKNYYK